MHSCSTFFSLLHPFEMFQFLNPFYSILLYCIVWLIYLNIIVQMTLESTSGKLLLSRQNRASSRNSIQSLGTK